MKKISDFQKYRAPALERGLDILEVLSHAESGLWQSQIAEKLGRRSSEIFRMLIVLKERGYIVQNSSDRYELSMKLFELIHCHPPTGYLLEAALPKMRKLSVELNQSCHMAVFHGNELMVIQNVESPGRIGLTIRPGAGIDLYNSASGPALLAFRSPDEIETRIANYRHKTPITQEQIDEFRERLELARSHSFLIGPNSMAAGITDIACPVINLQGHSVAVLTCSYLTCTGPADQIRTLEEATIAVKCAASEISRDLGHRNMDATPPTPIRLRAD